ncbi:tRNA 5-methoxyuridine(34)/uridine 5-oxyacetic acid(34) synthase CmoB [Psychrosphaera sp. 1_MG-2023]|uniref:tRNA 5-methoxyuridine(34)/uridine 5-oxyacetic acid(34) synthase CmoB n=1 Tax=Psychrosphaera sp. 1_MG-2023 TaxID=3062643 RepID=UPI0026E2254B|nr:tRNA 5-methoxyuridine(34)/uridine 5-oxyacetic acid(34) synthase CmoB [Psychrosphaera sp. 1_MG-2023]MDO6721456.1 tRNA 5-methoxyuridine(34)/uridine 5-oxyacetic acid(34) synthase CmoB [Psychrosphaera sp. 1_MG-2023]
MTQLFNSFYQQIAGNRLAPWLEILPAQINHWYKNALHGEFKDWVKNIDLLPPVEPSQVDLVNSVSVGSTATMNDGLKKKTTHHLMQLKPWRKGPYQLHGINVDTEWRSDFKWHRLAPFISDLTDRYVLDVGCGSGYHLWRMRGAGAKFVVGIDPTQLFLAQFWAVQHFIQDKDVNLLPLGIDDLPAIKGFDTVFSMGVLYHRKSPMDFLQQLKNQLVKGGELVLETLIVDGDETTVLVPEDRYAKMRNVWFIPSASALELWLKKVGFSNIRLVNIDQTTLDEQRKTDWIDTESLEDFLDPSDPTKTIEGYPAPKRAIFIANA